MGVKNLNKFIREKCGNDSIKCISMSELSGKKIAIDISIYIYKFVGDDSLIENMYLMLSIFRYYNIIPIFVFDGKPPTEKKELLLKRMYNKKEAENEYNDLKNILFKNENMDELEKQEIISTMDILKKQFVYIHKEQIKIVKDLITSYGMVYYDSEGEADEICAMLVFKKKVWACLSEDMDMFVYGCTRVLRYFSLLNHTVVLYNTRKILEDLGINQKEFREICILSGTDYNIHKKNEKINLYDVLKVFKKYHKSKENIGFYQWLINNNNDIIYDYDSLMKIYKIFDLSNKDDNIEEIKITYESIDKINMQKILEQDGFVFRSVL